MDVTPLVGTYRRAGVVITATSTEDSTAHLRYEFVDGMEDLSPVSDSGTNTRHRKVTGVS